MFSASVTLCRLNKKCWLQCVANLFTQFLTRFARLRHYIVVVLCYFHYVSSVTQSEYIYHCHHVLSHYRLYRRLCVPFTSPDPAKYNLFSSFLHWDFFSYTHFCHSHFRSAQDCYNYWCVLSTLFFLFVVFLCFFQQACGVLSHDQDVFCFLNIVFEFVTYHLTF